MNSKTIQELFESVQYKRLPEVEKPTEKLMEMIRRQEENGEKKTYNDRGIKIFAGIIEKIVNNDKGDDEEKINSKDVFELSIKNKECYGPYMLWIILGRNSGIINKPKFKEIDFISKIILCLSKCIKKKDYEMTSDELVNEFNIYISEWMHAQEIISDGKYFYKFVSPIWEKIENEEIVKLITEECGRITILFDKLRFEYGRQKEIVNGQHYYGDFLCEKINSTVISYASSGIPKLSELKKIVSSKKFQTSAVDKIINSYCRLLSIKTGKIKKNHECVAFNNIVVNVSNKKIYDMMNNYDEIKEMHIFRKIEHDIDLESENDCDEYLKIIKSTLTQDTDEETEEVVNYFLDFLTSILSPKTNKGSTLILTGGGGNGKSMMINLIHQMLDKFHYAASGDFLCSRLKGTSGANEGLASLDEKKILTVTEFGKGSKINDVTWKSITGEKTISARGIYEKMRDVVTDLKILLALNNNPIFPSWSNSVTRRLSVIQIKKKFVKEESGAPISRFVGYRDSRLEDDEFLSKMAGSLWNYLIKRLLNNEYSACKVPDIMLLELSRLRKTQDNPYNFVEEIYEFNSEEARKMIKEFSIIKSATAKKDTKKIIGESLQEKLRRLEKEKQTQIGSGSINLDVKKSVEYGWAIETRKIEKLYKSMESDDEELKNKKDFMKELFLDTYPEHVVNNGELIVGICLKCKKKKKIVKK